MMNTRNGIFALIIILLIVGVALFRKNNIVQTDVPPFAIDTTESVQAIGNEKISALYFTEAGCKSLPYVSALRSDDSLRSSVSRISAPDEYDYVVLDDTRGTQSMRSLFDGNCKDIDPKSLDAFQVFEVGQTLSN